MARLDRGLLLGTLVLLMALPGCRRKSGGEAPEASAAPAEASGGPVAPSLARPAPSASATTARSATPKSTAPDPALQLLQPGLEPRKQLRYSFREGQSDELEMKLKMTMAMQLDSESVPKTPAPETVIAMKIDVADVQNGVATAIFSVTDASMALPPDALPGTGAGVERLLADLKTYNGSQRLDNRGVLVSFDQDTSGITDPQASEMMNTMEQHMNQMIATLPKEAVGKGAKWRTVTRADQFGLKLEQTALFEIAGIDDKGVDLNVELAQTAPPGIVSVPNLPSGVQVELVSMDSQGQAQMRIDLDRMAPNSNTDMTVKMKMKMPEVPGTDSPQTMDMTLDMRMSISPK